MTTFEELLITIEELKNICEQALDLADEYSGGESETAEELRENFDKIIDSHIANL
jgi:hypothetical protein